MGQGGIAIVGTATAVRGILVAPLLLGRRKACVNKKRGASTLVDAPLRISNPERREGEIRVDDEIAGLTAARYSEYSAYTEAPIW